MKITDITIIRRNVKVVNIPFGIEIELIPGQEVLVTENKGGDFILNLNGNLVYLSGKDADAIGRKIIQYPVERYNINPGDPIDKNIILDQIKTVYDPEIRINIVDLGLIYNISTKKLKNNNFHVIINMTLTSPGCGMGPVLTANVKNRVLMLPNVDKVDIIIVFVPSWNVEMMNDDAKIELGLI